MAATSITVAGVIGTGVFLKARVMTCNVGSPALVLLAWVVAGALSIAGSLTYAELGAMMPEAGGEYAFVRARTAGSGPSSSAGCASSSRERAAPRRWRRPRHLQQCGRWRSAGGAQRELGESDGQRRDARGDGRHRRRHVDQLRGGRGWRTSGVDDGRREDCVDFRTGRRGADARRRQLGSLPAIGRARPLRGVPAAARGGIAGFGAAMFAALWALQRLEWRRATSPER